MSPPQAARISKDSGILLTIWHIKYRPIDCHHSQSSQKRSFEFAVWREAAPPDETIDSSPDIQLALLASLIDELLGTCQYCANLIHFVLKPCTRFFRTVCIESFDHKLIAMTKQTTSWDGSLPRALFQAACVANALFNHIRGDSRFYGFEDHVGD